MKRNLRVELWFVIITYGAMILFYFLAFEGSMSAVSWFMLIIGLLFVIYFQRKNKLLTEMECLSCEVKSNLQKQTTTLEKYIRIYLDRRNSACSHQSPILWMVFLCQGPDKC